MEFGNLARLPAVHDHSSELPLIASTLFEALKCMAKAKMVLRQVQYHTTHDVCHERNQRLIKTLDRGGIELEIVLRHYLQLHGVEFEAYIYRNQMGRGSCVFDKVRAFTELGFIYSNYENGRHCIEYVRSRWVSYWFGDSHQLVKSLDKIRECLQWPQ